MTFEDTNAKNRTSPCPTVATLVCDEGCDVLSNQGVETKTPEVVSEESFFEKVGCAL